MFHVRCFTLDAWCLMFDVIPTWCDVWRVVQAYVHRWHTFHIAGATKRSCGSCHANALLVLVNLGKSGWGSAGYVGLKVICTAIGPHRHCKGYLDKPLNDQRTSPLSGHARSNVFGKCPILGQAMQSSWDKPSLGAWLRFAYLLDSTIREPRRAMETRWCVFACCICLSVLRRLGIFRISFKQSCILWLNNIRNVFGF